MPPGVARSGILLALVVACGDDTSPAGIGAVLVVTPTQLDLADCATATLGGVVVDGAGTPVPDADVDFATADPGVAIVTASGMVTATGAGTTTIQVSSGSLQRAVPVEVIAADLLVVMLSAGPHYPDDHATAVAQLVDCRGEPQGGTAAAFTSLDPGVADVDAGGDVTAKDFGTARIVATAGVLADTAALVVIGHPANSGGESVATGLRPYGVAARADGLAYVTQLDGGVVTFDVASEAKLDSIPVGAVPTDVAFVGDGSLAWVANQWSGTIGIVDVAAKAQVRSLPVPGSPFRVLSSADGARAYVTGNADSVVAFDTAAENRTAAAAAPVDGNGLALHAGVGALFVGGMAGGLARFDPVTLTPGTAGTPAMIGQEVELTADGSQLYFADEVGAVHVLNPATLVPLAPVLALTGAFDLALTPDGKELWVTSPSTGEVHVRDAATGTAIRTHPLGGRPRRIAFALKGRVAVITDEDGAVHFLR